MPMMMRYKKIISGRRGVLVLLMIVLLSAFLSIAMGIVNILLGQLFIIGQAGESFKAFYANDIGQERTIYRDIRQHVYTAGAYSETKNFPDGSCYQMNLSITPAFPCNAPDRICIVVRARDNCSSDRYVVRQFTLNY